MQLWCLKRQFGILIKLLDALKAFVNLDASRLVQLEVALCEQLKVMCRAAGASDGSDESGEKADKQESFDGVPFFLPE